MFMFLLFCFFLTLTLILLIHLMLYNHRQHCDSSVITGMSNGLLCSRCCSLTCGLEEAPEHNTHTCCTDSQDYNLTGHMVEQQRLNMCFQEYAVLLICVHILFRLLLCESKVVWCGVILIQLIIMTQNVVAEIIKKNN